MSQLCRLILHSGPNKATYDWQGKSWLFFVHSHWEVLGYGKEETSGLEWAVTCEYSSLLVHLSHHIFWYLAPELYLASSPGLLDI